ncbi:conserved Plasmodium protein, unknown function [Plasmodium ovale wallikeri]|uniref:Uncharacterized protein n=1 Tax=Plasmodium ovale wallikeri TaxID=864142 RepID=A0A1A8ZAJ9_PLAOA|nr:conserved Plasmodium protein, unknown function [Plasmodium ovale wallikeri]
MDNYESPSEVLKKREREKGNGEGSGKEKCGEHGELKFIDIFDEESDTDKNEEEIKIFLRKKKMINRRKAKKESAHFFEDPRSVEATDLASSTIAGSSANISSNANFNSNANFSGNANFSSNANNNTQSTTHNSTNSNVNVNCNMEGGTGTEGRGGRKEIAVGDGYRFEYTYDNFNESYLVHEIYRLKAEVEESVQKEFRKNEEKKLVEEKNKLLSKSIDDMKKDMEKLKNVYDEELTKIKESYDRCVSVLKNEMEEKENYFKKKIEEYENETIIKIEKYEDKYKKEKKENEEKDKIVNNLTKEKEDIKKELKEKLDCLQNLEKKINEMKEDNEKIKHLLNEEIEKNEKMKKMENKYEKDIFHFNNIVKQKNESIKNMVNDILVIKNVYEELVREKELNELNKKKLLKKIEDKENELLHLKSDINRCKVHNDKIRKHNDILNEEIRKKVKVITSLRNENDFLKKENQMFNKNFLSQKGGKARRSSIGGGSSGRGSSGRGNNKVVEMEDELNRENRIRQEKKRGKGKLKSASVGITTEKEKVETETETGDTSEDDIEFEIDDKNGDDNGDDNGDENGDDNGDENGDENDDENDDDNDDENDDENDDWHNVKKEADTLAKGSVKKKENSVRKKKERLPKRNSPSWKKKHDDNGTSAGVAENVPIGRKSSACAKFPFNAHENKQNEEKTRMNSPKQDDSNSRNADVTHNGIPSVHSCGEVWNKPMSNKEKNLSDVRNKVANLVSVTISRDGSDSSVCAKWEKHDRDNIIVGELKNNNSEDMVKMKTEIKKAKDEKAEKANVERAIEEEYRDGVYSPAKSPFFLNLNTTNTFNKEMSSNKYFYDLNLYSMKRCNIFSFSNNVLPQGERKTWNSNRPQRGSVDPNSDKSNVNAGCIRGSSCSTLNGNNFDAKEKSIGGYTRGYDERKDIFLRTLKSATSDSTHDGKTERDSSFTEHHVGYPIVEDREKNKTIDYFLANIKNEELNSNYVLMKNKSRISKILSRNFMPEDKLEMEKGEIQVPPNKGSYHGKYLTNRNKDILEGKKTHIRRSKNPIPRVNQLMDSYLVKGNYHALLREREHSDMDCHTGIRSYLLNNCKKKNNIYGLFIINERLKSIYRNIENKRKSISNLPIDMSNMENVKRFSNSFNIVKSEYLSSNDVDNTSIVPSCFKDYGGERHLSLYRKEERAEGDSTVYTSQRYVDDNSHSERCVDNSHGGSTELCNISTIMNSSDENGNKIYDINQQMNPSSEKRNFSEYSNDYQHLIDDGKYTLKMESNDNTYNCTKILEGRNKGNDAHMKEDQDILVEDIPLHKEQKGKCVSFANKDIITFDIANGGVVPTESTELEERERIYKDYLHKIKMKTKNVARIENINLGSTEDVQLGDNKILQLREDAREEVNNHLDVSEVLNSNFNNFLLSYKYKRESEDYTSRKNKIFEFLKKKPFRTDPPCASNDTRGGRENSYFENYYSKLKHLQENHVGVSAGGVPAMEVTASRVTTSGVTASGVDALGGSTEHSPSRKPSYAENRHEIKNERMKAIRKVINPSDIFKAIYAQRESERFLFNSNSVMSNMVGKQGEPYDVTAERKKDPSHFVKLTKSRKEMAPMCDLHKLALTGNTSTLTSNSTITRDEANWGVPQRSDNFSCSSSCSSGGGNAIRMNTLR